MSSVYKPHYIISRNSFIMSENSDSDSDDNQNIVPEKTTNKINIRRKSRWNGSAIRCFGVKNIMCSSWGKTPITPACRWLVFVYTCESATRTNTTQRQAGVTGVFPPLLHILLLIYVTKKVIYFKKIAILLFLMSRNVIHMKHCARSVGNAILTPNSALISKSVII